MRSVLDDMASKKVSLSVGLAARVAMLHLGILLTLRILRIDEKLRINEIDDLMSSQNRGKLPIVALNDIIDQWKIGPIRAGDGISAMCQALSFLMLKSMKVEENMAWAFLWNPLGILANLLNSWQGASFITFMLAGISLASQGKPTLAACSIFLCALLRSDLVIWIVGPLLSALMANKHHHHSQLWNDILRMCGSIAIITALYSMYSQRDRFISSEESFAKILEEPYENMASASFDIITPTMDLQWYLMSEVFPSFRCVHHDICFLISACFDVHHLNAERSFFS